MAELHPSTLESTDTPRQQRPLAELEAGLRALTPPQLDAGRLALIVCRHAPGVLSVEKIPVGTRLRIGQAIVEVSPKPRNGCSKFQRRFGSGALRFVNAPATRHLNLRGLYWRVIEPGEARVGDVIQVLSRPESSNGGNFS